MYSPLTIESIGSAISRRFQRHGFRCGSRFGNQTEKEIQVNSNVPNRNIYLAIGGWFSLAFAVFQVSAIMWPPDILTYFGGPVKMQAENPFMYAGVCVFVGAIVAVCGLYALSGAGKFRSLPLLRTMLVAITAVFILRGLGIIHDLKMIQQHPEMNLTRFAAYSLIALCVGMIHLMGVIRLFRQGRGENLRSSEIQNKHRLG
jgi:hypothetical protein